MADELIAFHKTAIIEQGGDDLWHYFLGQIASYFRFKNTYHIRNYEQVRREAALKFANAIPDDYQKVVVRKTSLENFPSILSTKEEFYATITGAIMEVCTWTDKCDLDRNRQAIWNIVARRYQEIKPTEELKLR